MSITVKDEITPTINKLNSELKKIDKYLFKITASFRNQIIKRTRKGIDVNKHKFPKYSQSYMEYRKEHHRSASPVTLTYRGLMLNNMQVRKIRNGAEIYFTSIREENKALKHNEGKGRLPKREFFGFDKDQEKAVEKYVGNKIMKVIR